MFKTNIGGNSMELNKQNTVTEEDSSRKNEIPMNQRYTLSLN